MMDSILKLTESIKENNLINKPVLTVEEVAKILGFVNKDGEVNSQPVYDYIKFGYLKYRSMGYKKVARKELNRFIEETEGIDLNEEIKQKKAIERAMKNKIA